MKKSILLGCIAACISIVALLNFSSAKEYSEEPIWQEMTDTQGQDSYVVGGKISLVKDIVGDLSAIGGNVNINNDVEEDAAIIGGDVIINANIKDDLRIAGGTIIINGTVGGHVSIIGGQVILSPDAIIHGDLQIMGGEIILEGIIKGNTSIKAGSITNNATIEKDAKFQAHDITKGSGKILGNLHYETEKEISRLASQTAGQTTYKVLNMDDYEDRRVVHVGFNFFFISIFAILLFILFPKAGNSIADKIKDKPRKSLLYGFLLFAGIPFACLLLLMTIVGAPLLVLLVPLYIFMFVAHEILVAWVGIYFVSNLFKKKGISLKKRQQIALICAIALVLTALSGLSFILGLFAFGAIIGLCCTKK